MSTMKQILTIAVAILVVATVHAKEPLKVFILAGQSNMQGTAEERTLKGIGMDPKTKPLYDKLVDEEGNPRVYEEVSIVYFDGKPDEPLIRHGALTAGFGARTRSGDKTGVEFAFGVTMYEKLKQPILIIKTAWGGKDLVFDFRPPSAGPVYPDPSKVTDRKTNRGMMSAKEVIARAEAKQHVYYNTMVEHVNSVLADPGKYSPHYDKEAGCEIAGFVWFQGFNDMLKSGEKYYRARDGKPAFATYTELLADFIRDVRKEFKAPKMPFVIGVAGQGGDRIEEGKQDFNFRKAMAATAEIPEFKGNVFAVQTAPFWDYKIGEIKRIKRIVTARDKPFRRWKSYDQLDPEGKYADRRAKWKAYMAEMEASKPADDARRYVKNNWRKKVEKGALPIIYSPEELEYLEANESNATLHYWGSAKIYSRIGEAFAKAILAL